jgi:dTDP-4-amino-4,6-dideoxygalactose transaminase
MEAAVPAAEGGTPVREHFLPFARPSIGDEEIEEVVRTLRSGWLTVGPRTRAFERAVADYIGVPEAAALSSCTAGLHLGLVALGVGEGDEVVLPALDFVAGANCVVHVGARPVLVDVDPATLNAGPEAFERAITDRTAALMPVHYGGRPCNMDGIMELARSRGIRVLADAAHAMGAAYGDGKKVGSRADASSFSFYVTKGITTGEGGMLTSRDPELVERVGVLSLHGMSAGAWNRYSERGSWYYDVLEAGHKYNMSDMQAAIGMHQIGKVDTFRERRQEIADIYDRALAELVAVSTPPPCTGCTHAWHLYPIRVDTAALRVDRDQLLRALTEEGVGTSVHFIPVHYHGYYRELLKHQRGSFPVTETFFDQAVSLPIYPAMTDEDAEDVVSALKKLVRYYER